MQGVGRVLEDVVLTIGRSLLDRPDLLADRDHRVAESVEFRLRLALGGLDHERSGDRPAHGGAVEAVVHESLGHVVDLDSRGLVEGAAVDDELVGAATVLVGVEDVEVAGEPGGHVVGVEDRDLGRSGQSLAAHHRDVHPGDREDARRSVRRRRDRSHRELTGVDGSNHRVAREERLQFIRHADRSHAGATTAVRDAERLVQVEVADVGTDVGGPDQSDHGVHVRAVHVHQAARFVDEIAHRPDLGFEDAVGGWVGDHDRGEPIPVRFDLRLQVVEVDVARFVALDRDDLHARDHRAGGVGSVRRERNDADVAIAIATMLVIRLDRHQSRVLALTPGVRLQADSGESGDLGQPRLQRFEQAGVALPLLFGSERMERAEFRPGDRGHLAGRVELHRARAERDHGVGEREVARLQFGDVPEQRGLGPVLMEHGVGHVGRRSGDRFGEVRVDFGENHVHIECGGTEARPDVVDVLDEDRLVDADAETSVAEVAHVDPFRGESFEHRVDAALGPNADGVEERSLVDDVTESAETFGEGAGEGSNPGRDVSKTFGAVVDAIEAGDDREQDLGGADVARRAVAANVLFTGLDRHPKGGLAVDVLADADESAGHPSNELLPDGHVGGVGSTKAHGNTESLGGTDHDVRAPFTGRREQRQGERIRRHDHHAAGGMNAFRERAVIVDASIRRRILDQDACELARFEVDRREVADEDFDAETLGTRLDDADGLRVAVVGDEERLAPGLGGAHRHRFRGGRRFVEQRRVRDRHRGEIRDHRLEVEQCLKPSLGDLRLVRRVLRVPPRILEHGAQDHRGRDGAVIAHADVAAPDFIPVRKRSDAGQRLLLARCRGPRFGEHHVVAKLEWSTIPDAGGNRFRDQIREPLETKGGEHRIGFAGVRPEVSSGEVVGRRER